MRIEIALPTTSRKTSSNSFNGKHWGAQTSIKNKLKNDTHVQLLEQKPEPLGESVYPVEFLYHYHFKGKLLDWDNVQPYTKVIQDMLTKMRIIKNDNNKYITGGLQRVSKSEREYSYVVITIL